MTSQTVVRVVLGVALATSLSACVVAPVAPGPVAVYPARPVVVAPPVVVTPGYGYGWGGYWGHRHGWR